jgi:16S rRNA (guanine966-N2)-methyltransferase
MTRIVAGSARGRVLKVPPGDVRPTTARAREAMFSALEHRLGGWWRVGVLDLFAGSGAMGLEAASRGAEPVLLVDHDARVRRVLKQNVATVGTAGVRVLAADAWRLPTPAAVGVEPGAVDLVIVDPPYREHDERIADLLDLLVAESWLAADALALVERPAGTFQWPPVWESLLNRRYADSHMNLARLVASRSAAGSP